MIYATAAQEGKEKGEGNKVAFREVALVKPCLAAVTLTLRSSQVLGHPMLWLACCASDNLGASVLSVGCPDLQPPPTIHCLSMSTVYHSHLHSIFQVRTLRQKRGGEGTGQNPTEPGGTRRSHHDHQRLLSTVCARRTSKCQWTEAQACFMGAQTSFPYGKG